ncbi:MAG: DUF2961 domain-containing protein [Bacillota bacterium]|nr:DUF2961 domain-containing protein [Bacillota bacterium]
MTQESADSYILRKVTIGVYWDNEANPSVLVPLGDFFCLGHSMINSFQSIFFTASTNQKAGFSGHVALNCYLPMPFNKSARIELHNESSTEYWQYFYIDYQVYEQEFSDDTVYFHASFNRENPTAGWGHEITVNTPPGQYCQFN